jgi:protein-tyrosine phosphatase
MEDSVIMRNFVIFYQEKIINVQQIHIICWNDHTIPKAEVGYKALDAVMILIDDYLKENKKSVVVHCR